MESLIQWLTLLGGGLLGAIAIAAWFSSDRQLLAVWFGFAAGCVLLLAGALQLHQYVVTSVLQPKIELASPPAPSHFRWDPREHIAPTLKAPGDNTLPGSSTSPIFKISNASSIFTADVSLEWLAPPIDADQLAQAMPQFSRYVDMVIPSRYRLRAPTAVEPLRQMYVLTSLRETMNIPFLNRPLETFLPSGVLYRGLILLFAQLPDTPGNSAFTIDFPVNVTWNIPQRGTPQHWILRARVQNTKREGDAAIMDADITWTMMPPSVPK